MRIIVQRVFQAWVRVGGKEISRIKEGLLVLIGVTAGDNSELAEFMASKTLNMRLWQNNGKPWCNSVLDIEGEVMVVSQFTLYGIMKGNKPDFHGALAAEQAKALYECFVEELKKKYKSERIQTGQFQALMEVGSVINGPVTIQYQKQGKQSSKMKKKPEEKGQMKQKILQVQKIQSKEDQLKKQL